MAKITQTIVCKNCGETINNDSPLCPYCKFVFRTEGVEFSPPLYATLQCKDKGLDLSEPKNMAATNEIKRDLFLKLKNYAISQCSDEDRLFALLDAWLVIQNLLISNASADCMRAVTSTGKRIGELSLAIENYILKGGNLDKLNTANTRPDSADELRAQK